MGQSGYDDRYMNIASAQTFQVECGVADYTYISGETAATVANAATKSVPTKMTKIIGGWIVCNDAAGVKPLTPGCISSQTVADHTYGQYVDFTMDVTVTGVAHWVLFGI